MEWEIEEYQPRERGQDWYWAIGVVTLALSVAAFIFSDTFMLALFILVAGGTLMLFAMRDPDIITVRVTDRGVRVDDKLYPFPVFDSFWVDEDEAPSVLILKTEQVYSPLIVLPIATDIDHEALRDMMLEYLDEEEMNVPLSQKMLEFIGL